MCAAFRQQKRFYVPEASCLVNLLMSHILMTAKCHLICDACGKFTSQLESFHQSAKIDKSFTALLPKLALNPWLISKDRQDTSSQTAKIRVSNYDCCLGFFWTPYGASLVFRYIDTEWKKSSALLIWNKMPFEDKMSFYCLCVILNHSRCSWCHIQSGP